MCIRDRDSHILWEYEGSELAIDASEGALRREDKQGQTTIQMPERRKRLFREIGICLLYTSPRQLVLGPRQSCDDPINLHHAVL